MAKPDWKKILGSVAPALATALGGPLAGAAVKTIADKVLGNKDATEDEVEAAILAADPATLIKLREIDTDFRKTLVQGGIKLEEISAADRASARDREIRAQDSWTPRVLSASVVLGWMLVQYFLLHNVVPAEMREMIMRMLGTLDGAVMLVLAYYFGSSSSSRQKDETLSTIAKME